MGMLAFAGLLVLSACAPRSPVIRDAPAADPAVEGALDLVRGGQHEAAAEAWLLLAQQQPDRSTEFLIQAAEAWLRAGQPEQAGIALEAMTEPASRKPWTIRQDLARAELAIYQGDLATASWLLTNLTDQLPENLVDRHAMLDDMLRRILADPAREAFAALEAALYDGDFSPELALALLIEHPLASQSELANAHRHRPELIPWLDLVVSARRYLLDPPQLDSALQDWQTNYPAVGYQADQASLWLAAWRQSQPLARRIMVVLPARPGMARVSAALRDGLMTAWLSEPPDRRPELLFRLIEDRADAMLATWFEARELNVDFMIGPLERNQVDSLMTLPDPGMPILLLNHPSDPAELDAMHGPIQAIGLLPEEEAELAAVQSLVLGHQRALVLSQSTDWGERVARSFESAFTLGGGRILQSAEYNIAQADHSTLLEILLELDQSARRVAELNRILGQAVEAMPQPRTDADLIFLAARADDARQIRPQLRFFGIGGLPVFGTSHLIAGSPDPRRDADMDGIILPVAPWFLDTTRQGADRRQAQNRYQQLDNPTLSLLFALGADAFELTRWLEMMRQDDSLYLAGRTGRLRLPDGRLVERDLPFVRLRNGRAEPVQ